MQTINRYTAQFDPTMNPTTPRAGTMFRISDSADDRETDGLNRLLRRNGKDLEFVRWMPRAKLNIFKVVKSDNN